MSVLGFGLLVTPVLAAHYVVDQAGGGDFTTIQAALNQEGVEFRDTILVMPGSYPDSVVAPGMFHTSRLNILGAGGPTSNVVGHLSFPANREVRFEGLTLDEGATSQGPDGSLSFVRCSFPNGLHLEFDELGASNLVDCDFYARSSFRHPFGASRIDSLRFHGAPLTVEWGYGGFGMSNCTFEGPADTLVYVENFYDPNESISFASCSFRAGRRGVVAGPGHTFGLGLSRCILTDLTDTGIESADSWGFVYVADSRFERCGSALRWGDGSGFNTRQGSFEAGCLLVRDTISASVGDGIVMGAGGLLWFEDCLVDGSRGNGAVFQQTTGEVWFDDYGGGYYYLPPSVVTVRRSAFTNNQGDGLVIAEGDTIPPNGYGYPYGRPDVVDSCYFANNGGAGLRMTAPFWRVEHSVAVGNRADGILVTSPDSGAPGLLASNTSVLNFGAGFRFEHDLEQDDTLTVIQRNLAALNAGAGFRVPHQAFGSFAFNDAWGNYLGQYVGAWASLDSNLTVNPRFCDLGTGDLGLEQGSPCGPGGLYGLIGALPESCPNTLAVEPAAGAGMTFAVRPSVARGSVEFVPPADGGEGEVELFDLAGRVVWRAALGPGTGAVRWSGQGNAGRVRAGLYWARFARGEERATRRLVWLE